MTPKTTPPKTEPPPFKVVYAIIERGPKKHWLRIGLAFVNKDGSLNVRLDAVPLTGALHIRDDATRPNLDEPPGPSENSPQPAARTERKRP